MNLETVRLVARCACLTLGLGAVALAAPPPRPDLAVKLWLLADGKLVPDDTKLAVKTGAFALRVEVRNLGPVPSPAPKLMVSFPGYCDGTPLSTQSLAPQGITTITTPVLFRGTLRPGNLMAVAIAQESTGPEMRVDNNTGTKFYPVVK